MTVYFHGSFGLNRPYMAGILKRGMDKPTITDAELAKPYKYGAPFAARYRSWLHKIGIVELDLPIRLTPIGEIVYENDPNLESLTTQWLMHWELTLDPTRAEAWHFFIHEFLPKHEIFTRQDLINGLMKKLRYHSEKHFGPGSKLNPVIARKQIECYTEDYALGRLGILRKDGDRLVHDKSITVRGPWDSPARLRKAY